MAFDYFYGAQSQQFAFYRIPKVMFTDNRFQNISTEGKVLYAVFYWTGYLCRWKTAGLMMREECISFSP